MSPPRRAWLISSALTVAALVVVELGFRIAGVPVPRPEDVVTELDARRLERNRSGLSIRMFPRNVPVTTNRFGFRGRETTVGKPAGVYRIVALGDSTTFGLGVGDEETYCARLEADLNAGSRSIGRRFEVINAGVIGYTSVQGLRTLRSVVLPFKPDCIIVSFALNDGTPLWDRLGRRPAEIGGFSPAVVWVRNLLWNHSFACRWFLRDKLFWSSYVRHFEEALKKGWQQVPPDEYRRNLAEFARIAREHGADVVFLPLPVQLKQNPFARFGSDWVVSDRRSCQLALRRLDRLVAQTRGNDELAAMHFFAARVHETIGDPRGALDAYLTAMSLSDMASDLRWRGFTYATMMAEVAAREKVPLPNAVPTFYLRELADNPPDLWVDGYHPGPLGHRIIAAALGEVVRDLARRRGGR